MTLKIEKIPPVKCPLCKSTNVEKPRKKKEDIICHGCRRVIYKDGKSEPLNKDYHPRGRDPRFDTGDYLEGTDGVHEY